jgi:hypothetical protein
MFLTKENFDYSLRIIELYDGPFTEEVKISVAKTFARELFKDFDVMVEDDQDEILEMIIDDMSIDFYAIN